MLPLREDVPAGIVVWLNDLLGLSMPYTLLKPYHLFVFIRLPLI